ncbi:MAG: CAAX prenyl protease-related protein [Lentisphaerae bacterium]|nr:CAAX prenyl protease-related protein [Lentisphaerota bacterium]
MTQPPPAGPDTLPAADAADATWSSPAVLAHVAPFLLWVVLMVVMDAAFPEAPWAYAVRSGAVAIALVVCRPWRWYPRFDWGHLLPAVGVGFLVLGLWVLPFVGAGDLPRPWWQEAYLRFGVLPWGRVPSLPTTGLHDPALCGWPLALARLLGSALIIAAAEEFFWRGFLYRRWQQDGFLSVGLGRFDSEAFWVCALLFGLEHREVVAGILAGCLYTWLFLRTRDLWAAVLAHAVTNLLLGLYVLGYDAYVFW